MIKVKAKQAAQVTAIRVWFEDGDTTVNYDETALYYANQAENVSKERYMPYVLSNIQGQYNSKISRIEFSQE